MKRHLLLLFLLAAFSSQAQQWQDFTSQGRVKFLHIANGKAYEATMGGLVIVDLNTRESHLYTKANSGLASDAVEVIKTDPAGTIWIGTYDAGITAYDGKNWVTYNSKNSALPGDAVLALTIDSKNNKWIGTNKGLVKISETGWTVYNSSNSALKDDDIWALDFDKDGGLWIGCVTGTYLLQDNQVTDFSDKVSMYGVNGMTCMDNGEVFASGLGGVYRFKDGAWTNLSLNAPAGISNARNAVRDTYRNIWVATDYDGLFKYDGAEWTGGTDSKVLQMRDYGTVAFDTDGNIYTGATAGISRLEGAAWRTVYKPAPRLQDNYVRTLASDLAGKIWVGHSNSVGSYDGANWTYYTPSNSPIPEGTVNKVRNEKPGVVWICTSGGLVRHEGDNWQIFNTQNAGFSTNEMLDIAFDAKGTAWVSHGSGLSSYNGKTWQHFGKPAQFTEYERGTTIIVDKNNTVWLGTNMGNAYAFKNNAWTRYSMDNQTFPGGYVMDFTLDNNGRLWTSTWGSQLSYFDGTTWIIQPGGGAPLISSILNGPDGKLWTGASYPASVKSFQNDGVADKTFNTANSPISGKTVNALAKDENGNIWIGTSSGLVRYHDNSVAEIKEPIHEAGNISIAPNPFRDKTIAAFKLQQGGKVQLTILDLSGKVIRTTNYSLPAGNQQIEISKEGLSAGTYILQAKSAGAMMQQKLVVMP